MEAAIAEATSAQNEAARMLAEHDFTQVPEGAAPATEAMQQAGVESARRLSEAMARRMAPSKADENLFVEFYRNPVDGLDYVRIRIPGDRLFQPVFQADDYYKQRFARQWDEYTNNRRQFAGQTLLIECGWVDEGMREHLDYYGIKTVEALASLSDSNMQALGPNMRQLRDKAREETAAREKAAQYDEVKAEMEALRAEVAAKTDAMSEIEALKAEIAALKGGAKK